MNLLRLVDGFKTYLAALGLAGLGVFQISQGDYPAALQSLLGALASAGLRHAVGKG